MSGKDWMIVAAIGAGVFLLLKSRNASAVNYDTEGRALYFEQRDGVMYDQYGGRWA